MDQDPTPAPPPANDGKPGVFTKLNGTIAGITGLVIALGGLAATWDRIFPNKEAEAAIPAQQLAEAEAVPADETAAAAPDEAAPEEGAPTLYKGEELEDSKALTIEWDGRNWILTEGDDRYTYDELTPADENTYEAVSGGNYLRWPIAGGEVDESENRKKWETYGNVRPVADPAPTE